MEKVIFGAVMWIYCEFAVYINLACSLNRAVPSTSDEWISLVVICETVKCSLNRTLDMCLEFQVFCTCCDQYTVTKHEYVTLRESIHCTTWSKKRLKEELCQLRGC
eukprot:1105142_1